MVRQNLVIAVIIIVIVVVLLIVSYIIYGLSERRSVLSSDSEGGSVHIQRRPRAPRSFARDREEFVVAGFPLRRPDPLALRRERLAYQERRDRERRQQARRPARRQGHDQPGDMTGRGGPP